MMSQSIDSTLESIGRNIELPGGNLRKYIQNLKNMQITTSKFLPLPYNPWKYTQRHSASRTWSYRNNQRCVQRHESIHNTSVCEGGKNMSINSTMELIK